MRKLTDSFTTFLDVMVRSVSPFAKFLVKDFNNMFTAYNNYRNFIANDITVHNIFTSSNNCRNFITIDTDYGVGLERVRALLDFLGFSEGTIDNIFMG